MRIIPKNVPIYQCIQINDNFFKLEEENRPHFVNQLIELERFKIENNIASFKNETDQWINIPVNCFLIYDSKNEINSGVKVFCEKEARETGNYIEKGFTMMNYFLTK